MRKFILLKLTNPKHPGLTNFMNFNKCRKREICYQFRARAEFTGSLHTLKKRHLIDQNICTLCELD